ncbi:MAG: hypothetical protein R6U40_05835 [Desulfobacterales bacterium]
MDSNFKLNIIENEKTEQSIKAIVGKTDRATPVLSRKIKYLELKNSTTPLLLYKNKIIRLTFKTDND